MEQPHCVDWLFRFTSRKDLPSTSLLDESFHFYGHISISIGDNRSATTHWLDEQYKNIDPYITVSIDASFTRCTDNRFTNDLHRFPAAYERMQNIILISKKVYIYKLEYIYIYTYIYIYIFPFIYIPIYTHIHQLSHTYTYIHMYSHLHICSWEWSNS